jgi:hypothetical protein
MHSRITKHPSLFLSSNVNINVLLMTFSEKTIDNQLNRIFLILKFNILFVLMVCMDVQKHYDRFVCTDDIFKKYWTAKLKYFILLDFKVFLLSTFTFYVHISALHQ